VTIQEQWAGQGRRVLLVARRVVPREILPKIDPHVEGFDELVDGLNSELIIVGLVGLIDPLKPDIPETVRCETFRKQFFFFIFLTAVKCEKKVDRAETRKNEAERSERL
jgi:sodium/potassium-transporting ATPase subunit alpha